MRSAVLAELLSDTRPLVESLLEEPLYPIAELRAELDAFDAELPRVAERPLVDNGTARRLSAACRALLDQVEGDDEERLRIAQVAVRYLILDEDADGDTESPFGFDDDVEVYNAVCGALGLEDLLLDGFD